MCNDYRLNVDLDTIAGDFSDLKIKIDFPDGVPNVEARDDIKITDVAPIVRSGSAPGIAQLVQRRWSWPGPTGKPVYNFRSEGRTFGDNRCLIIADGFYEFTEPEAVEGAPRKKLKDKWLFTLKDHDWFCIAGIWRTDPKVGEAFTMLTTEPGPDVAPYHDRQIVVLPRSDWARWLDPTTPAADVLHSLPQGSLDVVRVR
ncbi:SOS response-associated peptidase [Sphingomonas pruni]|uniref:SOS response-associated peptidase n=1 Tax=Sphingomonas pruni TaxID=40683 RepID=UPI00082CF620|nr:SOS response-associated peptidase [Sphingomonas pruni]